MTNLEYIEKLVEQCDVLEKDIDRQLKLLQINSVIAAKSGQTQLNLSQKISRLRTIVHETLTRHIYLSFTHKDSQ